MQNFELSKWYADCTTQDGDAVIVYHAELRWRGHAIPYASLLFCEGGHAPRNRATLRTHPPLAVEDGRIEWKSPAWNAEGSWCETGAGIQEVLFQSAAGSVEWNCVAPRAMADVRIGASRSYRGWGYVEHLRLSIAPWNIPIQRLRWGRFISASDALVWIDWCGSYNRQVVYHNGSAISVRAIGDREIVLAQDGAVLNLDTGTVLRDGTLGSTALAVFPNLKRLFPARLLGVRECKWLSHAVLHRRGHADSPGMAIHELVKWP